MRPGKIVSGAQTGADRGALEAARALGLEAGGWVPRGRRAEDGRIPDRYPGLQETPERDYAQRTEWNVRDSDATLVVGFGPLRGGSALTARLAREASRPLLVLDLDAGSPAAAVRLLREWLERERPEVLNVAGPRASQAPRSAEAVRALLLEALGPAP